VLRRRQHHHAISKGSSARHRAASHIREAPDIFAQLQRSPLIVIY
jgi:hypothetical protein